MSTFLVFLLFALGLLLIIKGGDWFVGAAAWIAAVSGIPQFVIGATIVSIATTLPEIIVSVMAASQGSVAMATGNAIGSVTANTGMILAVSIIFMPVAIDRKRYLPKALIFFLAIVLLWAFSLSGTLTMIASVVILLVFILFIGENVYDAKAHAGEGRENAVAVSKDKKTVAKNILLFVLGAAGLVVGSRLLVNNGTTIATDILHIDERIVSLTMVAVGTSLPELVTTITAITKKQSSLSVGNIVGANIIDMLLILPLCSFVSRGALPVEWSTTWIDIPVTFVVALITLLPALLTKKFHRWQGFLALAVYAGYVAYLCIAA